MAQYERDDSPRHELEDTLHELEDRLAIILQATQAQLLETQRELRELRESFRLQQAGLAGLERQCDAIFMQVFHNLNSLMESAGLLTEVSRPRLPGEVEASPSVAGRSGTDGSLDSA